MQKKVLITGGAKRVGRAMALALAEKGWSIFLHYNASSKEAFETKRAIEQLGGECVLFQANLSHAKGVLEIQEEIASNSIQLLINNASIFEPMDFLQTTESALVENWDIHCRVPFLLSQTFIKNNSGHIINMLDTRVAHVSSSNIAYTLSKKYLAEMTMMLAKSFAKTVRVNAIAPGYILDAVADTPENILKSVPMGKKGDTSHVLHALLYLVDNEYVTGQILYVGGGQNL